MIRSGTFVVIKYSPFRFLRVFELFSIFDIYILAKKSMYPAAVGLFFDCLLFNQLVYGHNMHVATEKIVLKKLLPKLFKMVNVQIARWNRSLIHKSFNVL